jgi:hypothetical protein
MYEQKLFKTKKSFSPKFQNNKIGKNSFHQKYLKNVLNVDSHYSTYGKTNH